MALLDEVDDAGTLLFRSGPPQRRGRQNVKVFAQQNSLAMFGRRQQRLGPAMLALRGKLLLQPWKTVSEPGGQLVPQFDDTQNAPGPYGDLLVRVVEVFSEDLH